MVSPLAQDTYFIATENFEATYSEFENLYREHYGEMRARLSALGNEISPYNPRLDEYFRASRGGYLLTFTARCFGHPVGYANVYVTNDMHNGDRIAQEDALFVTKGHRKGVGRKLTLYGLDQLRQMGVSRLNVSAVTDTRAVSLWSRLGFRAVATEMVYQF